MNLKVFFDQEVDLQNFMVVSRIGREKLEGVGKELHGTNRVYTFSIH